MMRLKPLLRLFPTPSLFLPMQSSSSIVLALRFRSPFYPLFPLPLNAFYDLEVI